MGKMEQGLTESKLNTPDTSEPEVRERAVDGQNLRVLRPLYDQGYSVGMSINWHNEWIKKRYVPPPPHKGLNLRLLTKESDAIRCQ